MFRVYGETWAPICEFFRQKALAHAKALVPTLLGCYVFCPSHIPRNVWGAQEGVRQSRACRIRAEGADAIVLGEASQAALTNKTERGTCGGSFKTKRSL